MEATYNIFVTVDGTKIAEQRWLNSGDVASLYIRADSNLSHICVGRL